MIGQGHKRGMELASALLLGLAALATSWIGYQSSRWSGRQSGSVNESSILRMESNRAAAEAAQLAAVDIGLFTNWVNAYASGNRALDSFYRTRFRGEFRPAFEAWLAQKPLENPDAAPGPFSLPEYRLKSKQEAQRLQDEAEAAFRGGHEQGAIKDKYIANAVIMAMALFFTGMSRQFTGIGIQMAMIILAALLCVFGLISILTLPAYL